MVMLTVQDVPDEVYRALQARAMMRGHSLEAEVRDILRMAIAPSAGVKLGSLLAEVGRQVQLTEQEFSVFEKIRHKCTIY